MSASPDPVGSEKPDDVGREIAETRARVIEGTASVREAQGFIDFLEEAIPNDNQRAGEGEAAAQPDYRGMMVNLGTAAMLAANAASHVPIKQENRTPEEQRDVELFTGSVVKVRAILREYEAFAREARAYELRDGEAFAQRAGEGEDGDAGREKVAAWLYERILRERQVFGKPGEFTAKGFERLPEWTRDGWLEEADELLAVLSAQRAGEPTPDEVERAAKAMVVREAMSQGRTRREAEERWDMSEWAKEPYLLNARAALDAARGETK